MCRAGNVLGDPLLKMDGQAVFKLAVGVLEDTARAALAKAGQNSRRHRLADSAPGQHPHHAKHRQKAEAAHGQVVVTVDQHGNTSAASIPLALDHAVRAGQVKKGDTLMLEGVGGGFTWGAVLLDF
jgi:3-oxoacyl-[acyl-carrier-protein] synthase III